MKIREYFSRLADEVTDKHNLFAELMLAWIAGMLTLIVIFILIQIFFGG